MAGDMPVECFQKAGDHLPDEQGYSIDPLRDDHQVTFPTTILDVLRQMHAYAALRSSD